MSRLTNPIRDLIAAATADLVDRSTIPVFTIELVPRGTPLPERLIAPDDLVIDLRAEPRPPDPVLDHDPVSPGPRPDASRER
jgi:hypothetical protein